MSYNCIYYLAVDIGASSGRHILFHTDGKKIYSEEIYRFKNEIIEINGELCWDLEYLFHKVKAGIKKCAEIGKIPSYMGIDMWGVDFVLLDKDNSVIGNCVSYRDSRTSDILESVENILPEKELYQRTGIIKQPFNTIYQLYSVYSKKTEYIEKTETLLLLPSYLNFLLTGVMYNEYTNASTTGLMNLETRNWDYSLINKLGFKESIFREIKPAGTVIGRFTKEIEAELGFSTTLILPATHDTASAVLAAPGTGGIFISSGTWSLMGVEINEPIVSPDAMKAGFTNEGSFGGKIRFLKNIMGLWILQSVKKEFEEQGEVCDFEYLSREAELYKDFPSIINVNDNRFLIPTSMINEIKEYCRLTNQPIPKKTGEICSVIYQSLAEGYRKTAEELENITGKSFSEINIIGGGCKDEYLCRLTAEKTGKKITAGPSEATALGNTLAQMLVTNMIKDVDEAKKVIKNSSEFKIY